MKRYQLSPKRFACARERERECQARFTSTLFKAFRTPWPQDHYRRLLLFISTAIGSDIYCSQPGGLPRRGFEVSGEGGKGASFRKALQFGWCRSVTGSSRKDAPGRVVVGSNGLDRFPTCTKRIRDGGEIRKVPRPSRPKRLGLPTCAPKKKTKKTRIFGGTERRDRHGFNNEQRRLWAPLVPSHAEGEDRGGGCHRTSSQRKRIVSPVLMARAPRELSPSLAPLLKL